MRQNVRSTVVLIVALLFIGAGSAIAQHQHGEQKPPAQSGKTTDAHQHGSMDMTAMMNEPHHLLAMAYVKNISAFAAILHQRGDASATIDGDFARAATAEIRRSFDAAQQHIQQHLNSLGADMQPHKSMVDAQLVALRDHISALEREAQAASPNAKNIAAHAAEIHKSADEISKALGGHEGHKM